MAAGLTCCASQKPAADPTHKPLGDHDTRAVREPVRQALRRVAFGGGLGGGNGTSSPPAAGSYALPSACGAEVLGSRRSSGLSLRYSYVGIESLCRYSTSSRCNARSLPSR